MEASLQTFYEYLEVGTETDVQSYFNVCIADSIISGINIFFQLHFQFIELFLPDRTKVTSLLMGTWELEEKCVPKH